MQKNEIILYQPNSTIKLDVRIDADTVWLTQAQMSMLFNVDRTVIVKHIANIYKTCELDEISTCVIIAQVQSEGNRLVTRGHRYYKKAPVSTTVFSSLMKRSITSVLP